jgi:hypothetical protein
MVLDPSLLQTLRNVNVRIQRWLIGRLVSKVGVPVEVRYCRKLRHLNKILRELLNAKSKLIFCCHIVLDIRHILKNFKKGLPK